jgi:N-acetylglutamate synthase
MVESALRAELPANHISPLASAAPTCGAHLVRSLEERTATAWPGLQEIFHDGWVLRFGGGFTRRANCVLPLYASHEGLGGKIDLCEREYTRRNLPTVFKMLPGVASRELELELERRGYARRADTDTMICELTNAGRAEEDVLRAEENGLVVLAADAWLEAYTACGGLDPDKRPIMWDMLRRLAPACCLAVLESSGEPISCGLGVCQDAYVGLFCIGTRPEARNHGYGRQLLHGMLDWAREQGASRAFLQVQRGNAPAAHLYERIGFRSAYPYHYRVRDVA